MEFEDDDDIDSINEDDLSVDHRAVQQKEKELMALLARAKELKTRSEMGIECVEQATDVIACADRCMVNAKSAELAFWDCQILYASSMALKNSLHLATASLSSFNADVFAQNLISTLKNDLVERNSVLPWHKLERMAEQSFKYAPSISYLFGSLEEGPPTERKPCRQRQRKKDDVETYTNPRGLEHQEKVEIDMEERMKHISYVLMSQYRKDKKPVDFFSFVLDPDSYGKTVQNIFHVSHLVREGLFDLVPGDDKRMPALVLIDRNRQKVENQNRRLWHMALPFSTAQWEALRDTLKLKKAMICQKMD